MPPTASIVLNVVTTKLAAGLRGAMAIVGSFANNASNVPFKIGSSILHEVGRSAIRGITYRGLDFMAEQGKKVFDFQEALTRFGIAARIARPELVGVGDAIRQVSSQTGVDANEVLRGARAYVDLAGASAYTTEKMSLIARAAQASGSDINDMATVVYALQHSMSIPNTQLEDTIGGLINLSKDGAVHFNQMAQELISLAPVYAQFGITGRQGAIELASQLEVVRTGFGSASEAGTGLLRLYRSIPQHAKLFEKAGVEIFKPGSRTELLTLGKILENIKKSSLEKDRPALIKAFGRGEAERSYQLLDKLLNEYDKLEEAGHRNGVVQEDLATFTESAAGRMHVAAEKVKNAFAEQLTPERVNQIVSGVEQISSAMPGLFNAVSKVSDAWGVFAHSVARVKNLAQGDSKYKDTEEEAALIGALGIERRGQKVYWTPEERKRALALEKRDTDYNAAMASIMGSETDYGATDESIKKALRLALSGGPNSPGLPGSGAGVNYLADRKREISPERYRRIKSEIEQEDIQSGISAMGPQLAEMFKKALADGFAGAVRSGALAPLGGPVSYGPAAPAPQRYGPIEVKIDGNPVARAGGNASDRRRK